MHVASSLTTCEMKIETKVLEAENWGDFEVQSGKRGIKFDSKRMSMSVKTLDMGFVM